MWKRILHGYEVNRPLVNTDADSLCLGEIGDIPKTPEYLIDLEGV